MALLRYLWPGSVDVPSLRARRAAVEPREPVRGQGRRGSGGRCPVADPRAKLRAPRGDIFPAGPPAPAAAPGGGVGPVAGAARAPLRGGRPDSPGAGSRPTRAAGGTGAAETRAWPSSGGFQGHLPGRLGPAVGAPAAAAPGPSRRPLWRPAPVDALVKRLELPRGAEPRTDMPAPFPAPSERRGVGEAGPGRCTEEPRAQGARAPRRGRRGLPGDGGQAGLGPAAGARGEGSRRKGAPSPRPLALGRPERGAPVGPAGPSGLTPGDPALRRATAALAQAARPSGCVTVTGRLGQRADEGERGASPPCVGGVVVLCGGSGVTTLPGEVGEGRRRSWPVRGGVTEAKCVCSSEGVWGGGRARRTICGLRAGASSGPGPSPGEGRRGAGAVGRREGGQADARGGGEPRRRRRARAIRGRRIRACARRRSVRVRGE